MVNRAGWAQCSLRGTIQASSRSGHGGSSKEARDVSSCIAAAARPAGYYTENVSDYIDDPDRTSCLVRRYARFGDKPTLDRFVYENPHPDWMVLIEETPATRTRPARSAWSGCHDLSCLPRPGRRPLRRLGRGRPSWS